MIVRDLWARLGMQVDSSSFGKAQNALARLHLAFGGLRDIVMTIRTGLKEMLGDVAERAFDARRMANITGLTTDKVQELSYAAKVSGISVEELQHGLVHLSRAAREASLGNAEAAGAFYQLGVRATDGYGKARPLDQLLTDLAARFQALPDGPNKAALAMQVFSRGGARMIELLNKGPEGLRKLGEEARKLGVVMSSNAIGSAVKYREAVLRMQGAIDGLKNTIAVGLFPAISKSTEQITRAIAVHRKWIALKVHQAFELVSRAAALFFRALKGTLDLLERVWKMGSTAKGVLIGLGLVVAALVAPWASLAAAIALVAEDVELFFSSHGKAKTLTGLLVALFELLREKAKSIFADFSADPFKFLYDAATKFFDWFVEQAADLPDKIAKTVITDKTRKVLGVLFGAPPRPTAEQAAEAERSGQPMPHVPGIQEGLFNLISHLSGLDREVQQLQELEAVRYFASLAPDPGQAPPMLAAPPSINFGDVIIQGGSDGKRIGNDFVTAVRPQIREVVDEMWNIRMREAAAAVRK